MNIRFKSSDFEQVSYTYIFVNQTSGTDCKDSSQISAKEFDKDSIVLEVPTNSCAQGHSIMIVMFEGSNAKIPAKLPTNGSPIKGSALTAIGKIQKKEILDSKERSCITVKFNQYDVAEWKKIRKQYKDKQAKVVNIFQRIKCP